jgi:hypothetical protein
LWIAAWGGIANWPNANGGFYYYVPRWQSDGSEGFRPSTYISKAMYYGVSFQHRSDANISPYLVGGLWWPEGAQFATSFWRGGNLPNLSLDSQAYPLENTQNIAKEASFAMVSSDGHALSATRDAWMGWTTLELSENDHPTAGTSGPAPKWVNNSPTSAPVFRFTDIGLGVHDITASDKSGHSWKTSFGCTGVSGNPCPRTWASANSTQPKLTYDPSVLPQGINTLDLVATDPLGHASNVAIGEEKAEFPKVQVYVDHTAPTLTLSGTMTEQATLGTTRPQYTLKYVAKDGTTASPQSGIASVEVKLDGKKVEAASVAPNCGTENCEASREWTLEAGAYPLGEHTVTVSATDAVGLTTTPPKTLKITLAKDTTRPQLGLSGALREAPDGWVEQKTYAVTAKATDPGGYGAKQILLRIDNKPVAETGATSCPAGGCQKTATFNVDTTKYPGGAHTVEIIALDGAERHRLRGGGHGYP